MTKLFRTLVSRNWGVLAVLAIWEGGIAVSGVNTIVLPRPVEVMSDIVTHPAIYLQNGGRTLLLAMLGLFLGMTLGTLIASLAWSSRIISGILTPLSLISSSVPVVALVPIIARFFGYDIKTVLVIVVIVSFLPAFVFTSAGMKALPPGSDDLFRVFGVGRWTRFTRLIVPSAVPNWMIALRLSAPTAVLLAIMAEFLMGSSGLGYLFRAAASDFEMTRALGTSVVATFVSVTCFGLALQAERIVLQRWT